MVDSMFSALILFPYSYDTAPAQRFRWEQWETQLQTQGLNIRRLHFMTPSMEDLRKRREFVLLFSRIILRYLQYAIVALYQSFRHTYVIVPRNAVLGGPPIIEGLLFLLRRKVIYDFDDAIFMRPPNDHSWFVRLLRCDWRVAFICRYAKAVGVGNNFLGDYARRYNRKVFLWRTTIDTAVYKVKPSTPQNSPLVVGWTGSVSTSRYIRTLLPELAALQQTVPFELLVVGCDLDLQAAGVNGECLPWTSQGELALYQRMDIGLMPLNDTPWEKGKCSLKALQYQAIGIPAIVSDVGMNREAVLHEVTGLLVPPQGDWKAPITRLLTDAALRTKLGTAGREYVEQFFSARVVADKIAQDLKTVTE